MNSILIAAKADTVRAAGYFEPENQEVVPSPCVSICRMDKTVGLCEGCWRTIPEIRAWSGADNTERRRIWAVALARSRGEALPAQ